jgi:hypothetical protein
VNATTHEKKKGMVDRNILFRRSLPKPPRNRLLGSNARSAVLCDTKMAYALEN